MIFNNANAPGTLDNTGIVTFTTPDTHPTTITIHGQEAITFLYSDTLTKWIPVPGLINNYINTTGSYTVSSVYIANLDCSTINTIGSLGEISIIGLYNNTAIVECITLIFNLTNINHSDTFKNFNVTLPTDSSSGYNFLNNATIQVYDITTGINLAAWTNVSSVTSIGSSGPYYDLITFETTSEGSNTANMQFIMTLTKDPLTSNITDSTITFARV